MSIRKDEANKYWMAIAVPRAVLLVVLAAFVLFLGAQIKAHAADADKASIKLAKLDVTDQKMTLDDAQKKMQATFSKLSVTDFRESEIPGLYAMIAGNRVVYYQPEKEVLIFGEVYSKDGRSLTQEYLQSQQAKKVASLPLKDALVIGNGPKKIIEFTDPDCPYCQRLHAYLKNHEKEVTRYIFFSPLRQLHPDSPQKVVHILCAKDKQAAFDAVYSGKVAPTELKQCDDGTKQLQAHETVSSQFGVSGTPMLVVEGSVITGFQEARLAQYLNQSN